MKLRCMFDQDDILYADIKYWNISLELRANTASNILDSLGDASRNKTRKGKGLIQRVRGMDKDNRYVRLYLTGHGRDMVRILEQLN